MKKLQLLLIVLLVHSEVYSQVALDTFFPMGVMGISYGDTLLNTQTIVKAAGIRRITVIQTSYTDLKTGFSPITTYLNSMGKIEKVVSCIRRPLKPDTSICLNDTIVYDNEGRMVKFIYKDGSGLAYLQYTADYSTDGKVKYTSIHSSYQMSVPDTDIMCRYYNKQGQVLRVESEYRAKTRLTPLSASIYYNTDGLPDSIQHDNATIGTYVFRRKQKRKNKEIQMETSTRYFKWVYNASGQCISSQMASKRRNNVLRDHNPEYYLQSSASYEYNADGTLSRVIVKREGKKVATLSYSYEK